MQILMDHTVFSGYLSFVDEKFARGFQDEDISIVHAHYKGKSIIDLIRGIYFGFRSTPHFMNYRVRIKS